MGKIVLAGYCVAVREKVLDHYKNQKNAERRCDAERENGVDARVYPMFFSSSGALGNP